MEPGFAGTEVETEPTGRDVVREGREAWGSSWELCPERVQESHPSLRTL